MGAPAGLTQGPGRLHVHSELLGQAGNQSPELGLGVLAHRLPPAILPRGVLPPTWSLFLPSWTGQVWFLVWAPGHWLPSGVIPADSLAEALDRIPWS